MSSNLPKTVLLHESGLKLNQSTPQTITGGSPAMESTYVPTNEMDLTTKKYAENYAIAMSVALGMP